MLELRQEGIEPTHCWVCGGELVEGVARCPRFIYVDAEKAYSLCRLCTSVFWVAFPSIETCLPAGDLTFSMPLSSGLPPHAQPRCASCEQLIGAFKAWFIFDTRWRASDLHTPTEQEYGSVYLQRRARFVFCVSCAQAFDMLRETAREVHEWGPR